MNELTSVVLVSHLRIGILLSTLWCIEKLKEVILVKHFLNFSILYKFNYDWALWASDYLSVKGGGFENYCSIIICNDNDELAYVFQLMKDSKLALL